MAISFDLLVLLYEPERLALTAAVSSMVTTKAKPRQTLLVLNGGKVDANSAKRLFSDSTEVELIEHDNTGQEFGGYQAGLDHLQGQVTDRLVVMNDTVGTHDILTPAFVSAFLRELSCEISGVAVGRVDVADRMLKLLGLCTSRWIRSHFFGLDKKALLALDGRLYRPEIDRLIAPTPGLDSFFSSAVTGTLRERMENHLFSPESPLRWHSAAPLNQANCQTMAGKARAVLQEKYNSMLLEHAGVAFRPVSLRGREFFAHRAQRVYYRFKRRISRL